MKRATKAKSARSGGTLYFAAKISDHQFKRVLWHFTLDHSAREAARHIRLSANSINAIYAKLRAFFFDHGLFLDIYRGGDPRAGLKAEGWERSEWELLDFHLKRVAAKRGSLDGAMDAPDHHFSESYWRHNYVILIGNRNTGTIHRMMYAHLFAFVRRFGPVGKAGTIAPAERQEGLRLATVQMDQIALWLERNSAIFRDEADRRLLRQIRND